MKTHQAIAIVLFLALALAPRAGEIWVDASAGAGGSGSAEKPLQTISAAVKAAKGGDTITVRKGVYREAVTLAVSGTSEKPTVLRAAPGERAVVSGFVAVKDWKPQTGGLYTTVVDGVVSDLYVGLAQQPVSRWPGRNLAMRYLKEPDKNASSFKDPAPFESAPGDSAVPGSASTGIAALKEIAAAPKSVMAYLYVAGGNYFSTIPVKSLDLAARSITAGESRSFASLQGKADRYQLVNHPALIAAPGQWAFEKIDDKKTRLYFRPKAPADLERTQCRLMGERGLLFISAYSAGPVSNVRIEGLEICGSSGYGVHAAGVSNVVLSRCLIHNNHKNGVLLRRSENCQVLNNAVLANNFGVGVVSSRNALVQNNEIGFNDVDGLVVAGNVSGKPNGEPETTSVTVRRNYIHHHMLLSHPDNIQTYRGAHKLTFEDNVLLWGGQGIMTEETDDVTLRNCVVVGTGAVAVILGHGNSNNWSIENVTVGLGGWGAFSFTGKDYRLRNSIVWENPLDLSESLTSDYNLLYRFDHKQPICLASKPKWRKFSSIAEAATTGHEQHSQSADPQFRNAPAFQNPIRWDDANTASYLKLRFPAAAPGGNTFDKGDHIEINGDGVLRTVTASTADSVTFEPPLPALPFRDALIWNWKNATSTALDLRPKDGSPALTASSDKKPVGANLDVAAFQRGDFDGDGKRDIPDLPEDVKAALPDPNAIVIPVYGE